MPDSPCAASSGSPGGSKIHSEVASETACNSPGEHRRSSRQPRQRLLPNTLTGNEVFDLLDEIITEDHLGGRRLQKKRKKPTHTPIATTATSNANTADTDSLTAQPATKKPRTVRPRWYNQMYVMFLVLRQAPDNTASRSELVRKAVELDKKISMERGLPRAFTGKTPQNSASALLTNNGDRHFVQFRPEGARCYHFKLAYKPGDFDGALAAYDEWMEVLVKKDWPLCFGPEPLPVPVPEPVPKAAAVAEQACNKGLVANVEAESGDKQLVVDASLLDELGVRQVDIEASNLQPDPQPNTASKTLLQDSAEKVSGETIATTDRSPSSTSSLPLLQFVCKSVVCPENAHSELDANIPKSWRDIVEVKPSSIPGAGNGLFAIRNLPGGIPLGFYFGVPMTEDEFDSLKENVGMASHYSIMYRKTVLDATDENGLPYTDPLGALYCPFHFMNEDREGNRDNIVFLEGIKVNQIICLTSRQIKAGEELFVSYGSEVDRSHWDSKSDVSNGGVGDEEDVSSKIRGMRAATMATAAAAVGAGTLQQQQQQSIVRMFETLTTAATNGDDESAEDASGHRLEAQL